MGDVISAAGRFRGAARIFSPASHKFAVGASVVYRMGHQSEKVLFRVLRHLPDGGQGLQYRLKCETDGHERVTFEAALEHPESEKAT
ncbi:hypothetical protein [Methylocystis bryophila]|uniref:Uncharacterized protein n=1 Tax=Methylocystis bryophila TaxID=655015 RepID=A0A1W6MQ89_9HYPH|nr:hypothetical protein [Methylocystis bryophila]ARN79758.1 hypothetical protein B1812_00275 [Methylocystis bryophila]BDV39632.1 hypothetical protein DSM21852_28850 [Methylocystis bryophila]